MKIGYQMWVCVCVSKREKEILDVIPSFMATHERHNGPLAMERKLELSTKWHFSTAQIHCSVSKFEVAYSSL